MWGCCCLVNSELCVYRVFIQSNVIKHLSKDTYIKDLYYMKLNVGSVYFFNELALQGMRGTNLCWEGRRPVFTVLCLCLYMHALLWSESALGLNWMWLYYNLCRFYMVEKDIYLLSLNSIHPLEHKLGVTLNHRAETVPTKTEGKEKEQRHIRGALKSCGSPN